MEDLDRFDLPESSVSTTEAELDLTTLDEERLPAGHRSGFVVVVGRPNVGKSTLMNAYLGQKVAIVSPKPQTTRLRQLGILTDPDFQVVFVDTPGWHAPQHKLGEIMVETTERAIPDADLVLFLVDLSEPATKQDRRLADLIAGTKIPTIMALNKVDLVDPGLVESRVNDFRKLLESAQSMVLSAEKGENRDQLLAKIIEQLPEGPRYYPADQITDVRVRDLAGELIREQIMYLLRHEVPHSIAVLVDEFKERSEDLTYIKATIYVEKDSQKGIVIGGKGSMLKKIGASARREIEKVLGIRVYLDLWVKVRPGWRQKESSLRQFGYSLQN